VVGWRGRDREQGSFYVNPLGLGDVLVFLKNGLNGRWLFQARGEGWKRGRGGFDPVGSNSTVASGSNFSGGVAFLWVGEFGEGGGEEGGGGGAGCGELGFQRVHQGHQFVHLRHDPALFDKGWNFIWQQSRVILSASRQDTARGIARR